MRVLFLTDGFWPRLGGIETQAFHLIQFMQNRGHQFLVLSQRDFPSWKEKELYEDISIQRLDFNSLILQRGPKAIRQLKESFDALFEQFRPDLIHLNVSIGGCALAYLLFLKHRFLPVVMTAHAPYVNQNAISPLIEQIIASVDRIGCVSNWVLQKMNCYFPQAKHKLKLIYNGLPMPIAPISPLPFSPPILLLFGRLVREKGFEFAISAFSLLKKKGSAAQLIIAGGGPLRTCLEEKVKELGLESCVTFTGVLSQEELLAIFNRATILVVPSLMESFGLVILEAMQMQRPVIGSRVEGIPEVILDGETGLLVPPQNPLALCEAIETLLEQPDKTIRLGKNGYKRALQFSIEQNGKQFEELYQELVVSNVGQDANF